MSLSFFAFLNEKAFCLCSMSFRRVTGVVWFFFVCLCSLYNTNVYIVADGKFTRNWSLF